MDFEGTDSKQKWTEVFTQMDQIISDLNALCRNPRPCSSPQADLYREKLTCSNGGLTEENQTLRQQLTESKDTVSQLQKDNESLRTSSEDLTMENERLITESSELRNRTDELAKKISQQEDVAHQLKTDLAKLQRENESLSAASLDWKAENECLKAESSELKKENERLQIKLGIQTQSEDPTLSSQCLRADFVSKTSELVSRHKKAKYYADSLKIMSKLHQSIVHSLETFRRELKQWKEGLTAIDANLAKSRHRSGLSDPEEWSDDDDDHTKLNEASEECARMIEELDASHQMYNGFQCTKSGHLQQPVPSNSVSVVRSNVSKQDCEEYLHILGMLANEFTEHQRFLEKLHYAEKFPKEEKGKFRHIRKQIKIGEAYENEVKSVEETGKEDVRSPIGTCSAVQRSHEQEEEVKTVRVAGGSALEGFHKSQKVVSLSDSHTYQSPELAQNKGLTSPGHTRSLSVPLATRKGTAKYLPQESVPLTNLFDTHTYQSTELAQNEGLTTHANSSLLTVEASTYAAPHPKTVQAFLEFFMERILSKMEVVGIKRKLFNVGILPECMLKSIEDAKDTYEANSLFFQHAKKHYHFTACVTLCDTIMFEKGYPQMNRLGQEMWEELDSNQVEYHTGSL